MCLHELLSAGLSVAGCHQLDTWLLKGQNLCTKRSETSKAEESKLEGSLSSHGGQCENKGISKTGWVVLELLAVMYTYKVDKQSLERQTWLSIVCGVSRGTRRCFWRPG